jgi:hypothetical protein
MPEPVKKKYPAQQKSSRWSWTGSMMFFVIMLMGLFSPAEATDHVSNYDFPTSYLTEEDAASILSFEQDATLDLQTEFAALSSSRRATSTSVRPTMAELRSWLGHQAWKLQSFRVLEVFSGRGLTCDKVDQLLQDEGCSIKIGYQHGHDLDDPYQRWLCSGLVSEHKPVSVLMSWPCGPWSSPSNLNLAKGGKSEATVLRQRKNSKNHLRLFAHIYALQQDGWRHCYGENPLASAAWREPELSGLLGFRTKWHQCQTGLRSPHPDDGGQPFKKPSQFISTSSSIPQSLGVTTWPEHGHLEGLLCNKDHEHVPMLGRSYQSRSLTSWAEDYPDDLSKRLAGAIVEDIKNYDSLSWNETKIPASDHVAYVADEHPTNKRRKRFKWTPPEQRDGGGGVPPPGAADENADADAADADAAAEEEPELIDDETQVEGIPIAKLDRFYRKLHVGTAHSSPMDMATLLKRAGASREVVRRAKLFKCLSCAALKTVKAHATASTHMFTKFGDQVCMDVFFATLTRGGVETRIEILTLLDSATAYVKIIVLHGRLTWQKLTGILRDGWFRWFFPPGELFVDLEGPFRSEEFARFCELHRTVIRSNAAEAPWQHGKVENAQRTLRAHLLTTWAGFDEHATVEDLCNHVANARNDLLKVDGYSPNFAVLGRPPNLDLLDSDDVTHQLGIVTRGLLDEDPELGEQIRRRAKALAAFHETQANAKINRAVAAGDREFLGPFFPGDKVMAIREGVQAGHRNRIKRYHGPGTVIAQEGSIVWLNMMGRIWKTAPEQLRAVHPDLSVARFALQGLLNSGQVQAVDVRLWRRLRRSDNLPTYIDMTARRPVAAANAAAPDAVVEAQPHAPPADAPMFHVGAPLPEAVPAPGIPEPHPGDPQVHAVPAPQQDELDSDSAGVGNPADLFPQPVETPPLLAADVPVPQDNDSDGDLLMEQPETVGEAAAGEVSGGVEVLEPPPTLSRGRSAVEAPPREARDSRSRSPRRAAMFVEEDDSNYPQIDEMPDHDYLGDALEVTLPGTFDEVCASQTMQETIEACFAASAIQKKRAKSEVVWRKLSDPEKKLFRDAKCKEWTAWLNNKVIEMVSRDTAPSERVIRCRWVLTWKTCGTAKARLVLLGYEDPDLGKYRRDAPTVSRSSKMLLFATAAQLGWHLFSLDATTAFLSGDPSERPSPLYFDPPKEQAPNMQIPQTHVFCLLKAAYGLAEAPRAWWRRLRRELTSVGMSCVPLDMCLLYLTDKDGSLCGMIAVHVDDLLCAGAGPVWTQAINALCKKLPFGKRQEGDFVFTGVHIVQTVQSITIDQDDYIASIVETPAAQLQVNGAGLLVGKSRSYLSEKVGSLLYAVNNTQPLGAFDTSYLGSRCHEPTKADATHVNKVLRRLKADSSKVIFRRIPGALTDLVVVVAQDAGWASRADKKSSQAGAVFLLAHRSILEGKETPVMVLDWFSSKIHRVARSSLAAETLSATAAMDTLEYIQCLIHCVWHQWSCKDFRDATLEDEPPLLNAAAIVTDCRGLYSHLTGGNVGHLQGEKRLNIDIVILLDGLRSIRCEIFWVNNNYQISDALTKLSSSGARLDLLQNLLRRCMYRITFCDRSGRRELQTWSQADAPELMDSSNDCNGKTMRHYIGDHDEEE